MADLGPDEAAGGGSRPTSPTRVEESGVGDAVNQPMEGVQEAEGDEVLMARINALTRGMEDSGAVSTVPDDEAAGGEDVDADPGEIEPPRRWAWADEVQQAEDEEPGRDLASTDGSKTPRVAVGGTRLRGPALTCELTEREERRFFAEPTLV